MYKKNNKVFANAGSYLLSGATIGYEFHEEVEDLQELPVVLGDMELRTSNAGTINAHCTNGVLSFSVKNDINYEVSYADIKTRIIKERYSNDDQIAIMLNRDESEERELEYQRMQEWRAWATKVACKITELWESSQQS